MCDSVGKGLSAANATSCPSSKNIFSDLCRICDALYLYLELSCLCNRRTASKGVQIVVHHPPPAQCAKGTWLDHGGYPAPSFIGFGHIVKHKANSSSTLSTNMKPGSNLSGHHGDELKA
jgi:hypothetical protein